MKKLLFIIIISIFLSSQVKADALLDYLFCNAISNNKIIATISELKNIAIGINRIQKVLSIYTYNDKYEFYHYKTIKCSPNPNKTPTGLFHPTQFILDFHKMFGINNWCIYLVRFKDHYLIHSPIYSKPSLDSLKESTYEGIGTLVSGGCVRVSTKDAFFLVNNLKEDSPILIYDSNIQPYPVEELPTLVKGSKKDPTFP